MFSRTIYDCCSSGILHDVIDVVPVLNRCRVATRVPLALGFGVRSREDVQSLQGKVEIAVVGTAAIEIHLSQGVAAVGRFFSGLRLVAGV